MKHYDDKASAILVQKHQLSEADDKITEINKTIVHIRKEQENNNLLLEQMLTAMENLSTIGTTSYPQEQYRENLLYVEKISSTSCEPSSRITLISELDAIKIDENQTWSEYLESVEQYAYKNNINLESDPYEKLMTRSQKIALEKMIQEEFTLKNANCDKYDYMIAGTCGAIAGLIDILFVGIPTDSKLGSIAEEHTHKATEKFAELLGWDKEKAAEKGKNLTSSAIGFLERKFKINYDQAKTKEIDGAIEHLSTSNHHLKSLGHSPDIIGLFFSILNQFTNTSSFVSNGQIITIATKDFELQGHNFIAKIFSGFVNWLGHIMSDWTGSSGTVGQGGRGTGVPIPFYNLLLLIDIGEFGKDKQTFATIATKVFEEGYDFRHGMSAAIPVIINEILIRLMYTIKNKFYRLKSWEESMPFSSSPELRRMLLVGHGTLCILDGTDAVIRSGSNIVTFLLRTNLIAWTRFGHIAIKEIYTWHYAGRIGTDAADKYLDETYKALLR